MCCPLPCPVQQCLWNGCCIPLSSGFFSWPRHSLSSNSEGQPSLAQLSPKSRICAPATWSLGLAGRWTGTGHSLLQHRNKANLLSLGNILRFAFKSVWWQMASATFHNLLHSTSWPHTRTLCSKYQMQGIPHIFCWSVNFWSGKSCLQAKESVRIVQITSSAARCSRRVNNRRNKKQEAWAVLHSATLSHLWFLQFSVTFFTFYSLSYFLSLRFSSYCFAYQQPTSPPSPSYLLSNLLESKPHPYIPLIVSAAIGAVLTAPHCF